MLDRRTRLRWMDCVKRDRFGNIGRGVENEIYGELRWMVEMSVKMGYGTGISLFDRNKYIL